MIADDRLALMPEIANSRPCRSCGVQIVDIPHALTGNTAPIECLPHPDGNIIVDDNGTYPA